MKNKITKIFHKQKGSAVIAIIVCLLVIGFLIGGAFFKAHIYTKLLVDFQGYKEAKIYIENHPTILEKLGKISELKPSGEFYYNAKGGSGNLEIKIKGDKTNGTVKLKLDQNPDEAYVVTAARLTTADGKASFLDVPEDWWNTAMDYLDARDNENAQKTCDLMEKAAPNYYDTPFCKAEILYTKGDDKGFLEIYKKQADDHPNNAYFQQAMGYAYRDTGDYTNSNAYFKKAWELYNDTAYAIQIASSDLSLKNYDEALEWLKKAQNLGGDTTGQLDYTFGRYYLATEDYNEALYYFKYAKSKMTKKSLAYFGMAMCYDYLKKPDESIYYYELGIMNAPTNSLDFRKDLITMLVSMDRWDEATYHLLRTIEYYPDDIGAYVLLSKIYKKEGRNAEGDFVYQEAAKIDAQEASQYDSEMESLFPKGTTEPAPETTESTTTDGSTAPQ